jgi:RNA methyltransferase, TrmH family
MERIASRQNPVVKRFRELARAPGTDGRVLLDGEHLVEEALASGVPLDLVALGDGRAPKLAQRIQAAGLAAIEVSGQVLTAISPVREPSGVVAIARCRRATLDEALSGQPQLVLLLDGIQDAGNVGAIIRAAEACGATGIIAGEETADPFGWRALRGAMGSTFRVAIAVKQPILEAAQRARHRGLRLIATAAHSGTPLPDSDLRRPTAILLGAEGPGLRAELIAAADEQVSIPMRKPVESLNVAIAAALILYEASLQRDRAASRHHEPVR